MKKLCVLTISLLLLASCSKSSIDGLWVVQKVSVGEQEMTPIARWMRFNSDGTQSSGNGWKQHSIGTYAFENMQLSIVNTNGYKDEYDPFVVSYSEDTMYWKRNEDGNEVTVQLIRTDMLPAANADKLMGVWKLTHAEEEGIDVTMQYDPEETRYIYFRWDQLFVERNTPEGTLNGVYQSNGHRNEVQLIFNHDCHRTNWNYSVSDSLLVLSALHSPTDIALTYRRIDYFPN